MAAAGAREEVREGGCLCGAVRYRAEGPPLAVVHCHCASCRRAAGAPVVTWAIFPRARFTLTAGEPVRHASSPAVARSFCGRCGSPLTYETDRRPDQVDVTVGTLDRPEGVAPTAHVWTAERVTWLDLRDDLPRHHAGGGGSSSP